MSATLHSLADLVPVLGASVVVGQQRAKLFADGRPLVSNASRIIILFHLINLKSLTNFPHTCYVSHILLLRVICLSFF